MERMRHPLGEAVSGNPGPHPAHEGTLSDTVYRGIFSQILEGRHPPDSRLPSESALADQFGVSRPIVREALARLRDDGLVVSRRGSGSYVMRRPDRALLDFTPLEGVADMQRCFEFRAGLEGEAAFLAASRCAPAALRQLERALAVLAEAVNADALGVEADFDFHMAIALATENRFYVDCLERLHATIGAGMTLARNLSLLAPRERLVSVQNEHFAIFAQIRDREPELARAAMRDHLNAAKHRVFDQVREAAPAKPLP